MFRHADVVSCERDLYIQTKITIEISRGENWIVHEVLLSKMVLN